MANNNSHSRPKKRFFKSRNRRTDDSGAPRKPQRMKRMKKGIFILPSLLTLTSIFLSFYAIVSTIKGQTDNTQFVLAAALILIAGFFDGIDGKVARLTKTTTKFGLELDSLADVISFGVAPALLMYIWALEPYGRVGWVSAFVFVSCGALRLARFNVQSSVTDPKRFNGLPIPMAAAMVATTVLFFAKLGLDPATFRIPLFIMTYVLSFLMVSSVKFHAFKDLTLVKRKPFSSTVAFVLVLALIAASPSIVPFFLCAGYVLSGPLLTLHLHRQRTRKHPETKEDPDNSDKDWAVRDLLR